MNTYRKTTNVSTIYRSSFIILKLQIFLSKFISIISHKYIVTYLIIFLYSSPHRTLFYFVRCNLQGLNKNYNSYGLDKVLVKYSKNIYINYNFFRTSSFIHKLLLSIYLNIYQQSIIYFFY